MSFQVLRTNAILGFALCVLISGCLLQRISALHDQVCNFDENFEMSTADGFRLTFLNPVVLDRDVILIAGAEPYMTTPVNNGEMMKYRIRKNDASSDYEVLVDLRFLDVDGEMKLNELFVDTPFPVFIPDEQISRAAERACNLRHFYSQRFEYPLEDVDESLIPTLSELKLLAGEPSHVSDDGLTVRYDYIVEGTPKTAQEGYIEFSYNSSGTRLLLVRSKFARYVSIADFRKKIAYTRISL